MNFIRAFVFILAALLFYPAVTNAQVDVALKVRGTSFYGMFGQTYSALGYEPSITIKPAAKPWAGGLSYSKSMLAYDAESDLEGKFNLVTLHAGAKGSLNKYFHPFAYVLAGFRFMSFTNPAVSSEDDPLFTSFSLGYGARTGVQIGGDRWRFEGSMEYMSGTKAKYLTPDSFEQAAESGKSYREFTGRSPISGLSVGIGVAYTLNWTNISIE